MRMTSQQDIIAKLCIQTQGRLIEAAATKGGRSWLLILEDHSNSLLNAINALEHQRMKEIAERIQMGLLKRRKK